MKNYKSQCWVKTHRRMKWRLAMRISSLLDERWVVKAAEWNPELKTKYKTHRAVGRPKRRCEDEINEFFKPETTTGDDMMNNKSKWQKKGVRWMTLEGEYARTAEDLWTMCYAEKTHHKIQFDQHDT